MVLTENETHFLLYATITMLGIFAFIGSIGVNALIKMGRDLNEIKVAVKEVATKHEDIEKRVNKLETKLWN
jgi:hypothetical protein